MKIFVIIVVLLMALAGLYYRGEKSVHIEKDIAASPKEVWKVLINTEAYADWNTVIKPLSGTVLEGQKLKYEYWNGSGKKSTIKVQVRKVSPERLLQQGGGIPMIFSFEHQYQLQAVNEKTRLIIHQEFRGIGVNFWEPRFVQQAFERLALEIKTTSEHKVKK